MRLLPLALLAALVLAIPAGASNSVTYQDSVGEGGGDPAVPDITTTVVSNDDTGMITIRINVPNRPALTRDMEISIIVDSDSNTATGFPNSETLAFGAEYVIQLLLGEVFLYKWDGTDFTRRSVPQASLAYQYANGGATITISATDLGNTKRFGFSIIVGSGLVIDETTGVIDDTNEKLDFAPSPGAGFYTYEVKIAPARLVAKKLSTTPSKPRAGKTFTVRLTATRSDTGATIVNGQVDCTAKAGGKALKPKSEKFVGGQAVCVFQVPAGTEGKTLRGKITIVFEGKKLARPFSGKIS